MASPSFGPAHDDLAALDVAKVKSVHRLAGFEHHKVGDVDDVVDRAHAGRLQASASSSPATSLMRRFLTTGHNTADREVVISTVTCICSTDVAALWFRKRAPADETAF